MWNVCEGEELHRWGLKEQTRVSLWQHLRSSMAEIFWKKSKIYLIQCYASWEDSCNIFQHMTLSLQPSKRTDMLLLLLRYGKRLEEIMIRIILKCMSWKRIESKCLWIQNLWIPCDVYSQRLAFRQALLWSLTGFLLLSHLSAKKTKEALISLLLPTLAENNHPSSNTWFLLCVWCHCKTSYQTALRPSRKHRLSPNTNAGDIVSVPVRRLARRNKWVRSKQSGSIADYLFLLLSM